MGIEDTDLPEEVLAQLRTTDGRGTSKTKSSRAGKIRELAEIAGGELNFNQFIIAAYRKYGEVWDRKKLRTDISALANRGELIKVKNGIYRIS